MFEYFARIDEQSRYKFGAYDGDTIDLVIDVGFRMYSRQRIRVLGINTPEIRGESKPQGMEAAAATRLWLDINTRDWGATFPFIVKTEKADAFGRYLADIKARCSSESLTDYLLGLGYPPYKK